MEQEQTPNELQPENSKYSFPDSTTYVDPFRPRRFDYYITTNSITIFPPVKQPIKKNPPYVQHILRSSSQISSLKSFPVNDIFALGTFNTIYVLAPPKVEISIDLPKESPSLIECIDVHPSEVYLACDGSSNVRIISIPSGEIVASLNRHSQHVSSVFFAPTFNKVISTSFDGSLIISDFVKQKLCYRYDKFLNERSISTGAIRDDESIIVVGFNNGIIGIFDDREENGMIQLNAHSSWINSIAISSKNIDNACHIASSSTNKDVKIWDIRNLSEPILAQENSQECNFCKVMFSDDQSFFAMGVNGIISRWDYAENSLMNVYDLQTKSVTKCDLQRDFRRINFAGDNKVVSSLFY